MLEPNEWGIISIAEKLPDEPGVRRAQAGAFDLAGNQDCAERIAAQSRRRRLAGNVAT